MSIFIKNNHFCLVKQNSAEILENFIHRGYAIISQSPKNQDEYNKYVRLSNYLINQKYLGCSYDEKTKADCLEMEKTMMKS